MHLDVFGRHVIVLNSMKAAIDLFERRSVIYSSRPGSVMLNELWVRSEALPILLRS